MMGFATLNPSRAIVPHGHAPHSLDQQISGLTGAAAKTQAVSSFGGWPD
jgi:hypothetical protein